MPSTAPPRNRRSSHRRRISLESLECRRMLASMQSALVAQAAPAAAYAVDVRGPMGVMDVNGDGKVSPQDALFVINALNDSTDAAFAAAVALDVNGDGELAPIDGLLIINHLNAIGTGAVHEHVSQPKVLFLRGGLGTGGFLEGGGDDQLADIGDYATNGGNHGWGELADTLISAGFILEQMEEGSGSVGNGSRIPLSTLDLSQYSVIVFGSNNAVYTAADVDAVEHYIKTGGGALFISDANFGSDWADASNSDQQFLDRIGIEVHQDQGTYVVGSQAGEILEPSHPLFVGVRRFDGEGVTPFHVAETVPGVAVTLLAGAEGNTRLNQPPLGGQNRGPSRSTNSSDASVISATWGRGRIIGHFDRNTFFNLNGAGTNINRFDNRVYAVNLFEWLAQAPLIGDFDLDCTVDAQDYAAWASAFGSTNEFTIDGNADGIVDAADYTLWRDHLGTSQCVVSA